jgi:hypothetical protein
MADYHTAIVLHECGADREIASSIESPHVLLLRAIQNEISIRL